MAITFLSTDSTSLVGALAAAFASLLVARSLHLALLGAPGPFAWPIFGQNLFLAGIADKGKVAQYFKQLHDRYGRIVRLPLLGPPFSASVILVAEANAAKQILGSPSDFDRSLIFQNIASGIFERSVVMLPYKDWKLHRKILQPAFGPTHLRHTALVSKEIAKEAVVSIRAHIAKSADGKSALIDGFEYFAAMTVDAIGRIAFSHDFKSIVALDEGKSSEAIIRVKTTFGILNKRISTLMFLWESSGVGRNSSDTIEARKFFKSILFPLIKERRELKLVETGSSELKGHRQLDALDRLLDNSSEMGGGLTDDEILDEVINLFIAGHETSANTMTFIIFELCRHPDVMNRLFQEIDELFVRFNGNITTENLHEFRYLDWVIKETQRFYPVVFSISRDSTKPVEVLGYKYPAGQNFNVTIESIHFDPLYWKDPLVFNPDRWAEPPVSGSYLPFGDGPMNCIGQKMAGIEIRIMMIYLLRHFSISLPSDQTGETVVFITKQLKNRLKMVVSDRVNV